MLDCVLVPNDKDNWYAFVKQEHLLVLESNALSSEHYSPVLIQSVNWGTVANDFSKLAMRIQKFMDQPGTARSLLKPMGGPLASTLGLTVKAHKPAGEKHGKNHSSSCASCL